MSYQLIKGNLFDQDTEALGHGVNIFGAMYAGIANQFRIRYPEMFEQYKHGCKAKIFKPGDVFHYHDLDSGKHIFNLFSQSYPGPYARVEWLKESLTETIKICEKLEIKSLGCCLIGGGIGGLDPEKVLEIFEEIGNTTKVKVVVCVF